MIFLFIPKNNEDSWFRILKGFSITTPSNINWQHISMNILPGHPPEVPNHCVWNSHLWLLNLTSKDFFTILSFTKTHGNLVMYNCYVIREGFPHFPWGFETPCGWTWSSWAGSAGKNLLHIAHAPKPGTFVMSLLEALFWGNSHKMGPVTGYTYL